KALPAILRGLSAFIIILLLCAPFITSKEVQEVKPRLAVLVDRSTSMKHYFTGADSYKDTVDAIIGRLSAKYDVSVCGWGSSLISDSIWNVWHNTTQLSTALQQLDEQNKIEPLQSVLLISDGISN